MQARPAVVVAGGVAALVVVVVAVFALTGGNDDDGATLTQASNGEDGGLVNPGEVRRRETDGEGNSLPERDGPHVEAVVSAHDLATQAGVQMLEQGGNAADAAIAVAAALSVVEPWFSSVLGGGTWGLYYDAENSRVTSLDGVGPTGSNATVADFGERAETGGIHQSNVPGAWDGWMLWLRDYGTLDLGDILAPAIEIARAGYEVSPQMDDWLGRSAIAARPDTAAIYAPNGVVLEEGDTVFQHDLADTFEALAAAYDEALPEGRDAAIQAARDYYYRGPLAEAIVAFSDANGGYLTLEDFRGFEAAIVEPIAINWDDEITVYQNPPNSQGITMLMALNILKQFDFAGLDYQDPDVLHVQVEALKLAFTDRNNHVGDPARIDVPVEHLLSKEHAESQRERISMDSVLTWPIDDGLELSQPAASDDYEDPGGTTTFHITDQHGNGVAVTTSLGAQFLVAGNTGIHMNNRMRMLQLEDGDPNQLTPGARVRHTSNPYMAFRNGRLFILGGNTGVDTQPQGQVQQFLNIAVFGLGAQEAVSTPRFVSNAFPASTYPYGAPNTLDLEDGFPGATIEELEERGHEIDFTGTLFGTAAAIIVSQDGSSADVGADERNHTSTGVVLPRGD